MAATANQSLSDYVIGRQIKLMQFIHHLQRVVAEMLDSSDEVVRNIAATSLANLRAIEKASDVMALLDRERQRVWNDIYDFLWENLEELPTQEAELLIEVMDEILPVWWTAEKPQLPDTAEIIVQGATLRQWVDSTAAHDHRIMAAAIVGSMMAGESGAQAVARLTGSQAVNYADGQLAIPRRNIGNVIRTMVLGLSSGAKYAVVNNNREEISREKFVAILDGRTSAECRSNNGKVFDTGSGPVPPLHVSCRSTRVPVFARETLSSYGPNPETEDLLLREFARDHDLSGVRSRSSLDSGDLRSFESFVERRLQELIGDVPANETFSAWLRRQPDFYQDELLGPARARQFREGKLDLDEFVNYTGRELTFQELGLK